MQTYISILRGINVSGKNLIKMDALRNLFSEMGFASVLTYIQSGNIIFKTEILDTAQIQNRISLKIKESCGFDVPTLVFDVATFSEILSKNPFLQTKESNLIHITFLSKTPDNQSIQTINPEIYPPDEFRIIDRAVYLYCPNGYGSTKLHNTFLEKKLKVQATTRNLKTSNELLQMALGVQNP